MAILLGLDPVQDLLALPDRSPAVSIDVLARDWPLYRDHFKELANTMFGSTPMLEAFRVARDQFALELGRASFTPPPILFVLSDGEPDHEEGQLQLVEAQIWEVAQSMKDRGILVVSCFFTDDDMASPHRLYGELDPDDLGHVAAFMHSLASPLPEGVCSPATSRRRDGRSIPAGGSSRRRTTRRTSRNYSGWSLAPSSGGRPRRQRPPNP